MSTNHRALITRCSLLAAAATVASFSSVLAADLTVPGTHATLAAAVAAAVDNDRILLADGTHALSTTLQVNKEIIVMFAKSIFAATAALGLLAFAGSATAQRQEPAPSGQQRQDPAPSGQQRQEPAPSGQKK